MKKIKFYLTILSIIAFICVFCACLLPVFSTDKEIALADGAVISSENTEMKTSYLCGTELTLPKTVLVEYGGETYTATDGALRYPDGGVYSGVKHKLNQIGNYTVSYLFTVNNKTVQVEKTIQVYQNSWTVSSERSKVEWGATKMSNSHTEGLIVSLVEGDSFTYNVPFDLTDTNLSKIINFNPLWDALQPQAHEIVVTLTDAYDSNIKLVISGNNPSNKLYFKAGKSDYLVGCETYVGTSKPFYLDGIEYRLHTNDQYGQNGRSSNYNHSGVSYFYDLESKRIYAQSSSATARNYQFVTDLDESLLYPTSESMFAGFTTGEVFVSISCKNYNTSIAQLAIGEIFGVSGENLKGGTEFNAGEYLDDTAPIISVDASLTDLSGVYAVKGEEVSVFEAVAFDINLIGGVNTNVYYNYGTVAQTNVMLQNGTFKPNKIGCYTIEYSAVDSFGNRAIETVYVNVIDNVDGELISKGIEFCWTQESLAGKTFEAGKEAVLPSYSIEGINQDHSIEIIAISEYGNEIKVDVNTNSFIPSDVGEYKIIYHYWDNVYEYEEEYEVSVVASDAVNFLMQPVIPKYFIKNMEYSLEPYFAYEYKASGLPTQVATTVEIKFDNDETYTSVNPELVKITGSETVQIRYVALGNYYETEKLPIIDVNFALDNKGKPVGGLDAYKYFQGDFTVNDKGAYVSNQFTGNNTLEFINPISASTFVLETSTYDAVKYTEMRVILTDYYDEGNEIVILLQSENITSSRRLDVSINGGAAYSLTGNFADSKETKRFSYNANSKTFVISANKQGDVAIEYKLPFKTDLCFLKVELVNISTQAGGDESERSIKISKVCNQMITASGKDTAKPIPIADSSNAGYKDLNDLVKIYPATIADAFSTVTKNNIKVTVTSPTGGYAIATDGTRLNGAQNDAAKIYELKLSEYGTYRVTYEATDSSGQKGTYSYSMTIVSNFAPTVTIEGGANEYTLTKAKVNKEYTVKDIEYSDDITPKENITVAYYIVNENFACVSNKPTFTFYVKGIYTVYYYVIDEDGNSTIVSYKVKVE